MGPEPTKNSKNHKTPKASVHLCPQCGFAMDLRRLGLPGGATGFATCPKCDWSAPIDMRIVEKDAAD